MNCQDMSQSAQGRDKSCRTYQTLRSVLERMSFVQGPIEMSCSGQERGVKEDKLDCYCVNCGVYIHAMLSTYYACYISTKRLPDLGKGALMVTDTRYNFCTPDEKGGNCCQ